MKIPRVTPLPRSAGEGRAAREILRGAGAPLSLTPHRVPRRFPPLPLRGRGCRALLGG